MSKSMTWNLMRSTAIAAVVASVIAGGALAQEIADVPRNETLVLTPWGDWHPESSDEFYRRATKACPKCCNGWTCTLHEETPWPHDDCDGPRTPCGCDEGRKRQERNVP